MNNRIDTIRFEANSVDVVRELVAKGEAALKISISSGDALAADAGGSFHIAQILCHEVCLLGGVSESSEIPIVVEVSLEAVKDRVLSELGRTFSKPAIKFARGPRFRRVGRAPYLHLLRWLSDQEQGALSIESALALYPDFKGTIGQIVDKKYLTRFLETNSDLQDVVHFDEYTKMLAIEDPKFIYYINNLLWSKFVREAGFISVDFKSKYDFAMSFAGEVRAVVEIIKNRLAENEVAVFYDFDEQHRILARDVEEYLAPIYRTEARYVVTFLSKEYPRKVWTKFESEQFRDRFGQNSVIPILFKDAPPGVFDIAGTVGGLMFDPSADLNSQAEAITSVLLKKLEDDRAEEAALRREETPEAANDEDGYEYGGEAQLAEASEED